MLWRCRHCGARSSEAHDIRSGTDWSGCELCGAPSNRAPVNGRPPTPLEETHTPTAPNPLLRNQNTEGYRDDTAFPLHPRTYVLPEGTRVRKTPPGQPTVADLLETGDLIDRSGPEPLRVVDVTQGAGVHGVPYWNIHVVSPWLEDSNHLDIDPHDCSKHGHISRLVAQDGEIRGLFYRDDTRIEVVGKADSYQPTLTEVAAP